LSVVLRRVEEQFRTMAERYSYKIVFLGNKGIGVHSTLARLTDTAADRHDQINVQAGMPQEEKRKRVVSDGNKEYEFWFHETAGQEIFRGSVTSSYFRHAVAIIYAYDETDPQSFADIQNWMLEATRCGADGLINFLIGNKMDLVEKGTPRGVSEAQAQELAGNSFVTNPMHVSALTGAGCEEAFNYITQHLIQHAKGSKIVTSVVGDEEQKTSTRSPDKKKNKCMC